MNLVLLILRLLLGTPAPSWSDSWSDSVPLAVRRDGRLQNRLERRSELPHDRRPVGSVLSQVWKAVVRAVGWVGRWVWPTGRARGS
jgi:hypothetical protein